MKNNSIILFISKYRKYFAKKLFITTLLHSIFLLMLLLLFVIIIESLYYLNPIIKIPFLKYSFIIAGTILLYPFIVWAFYYYNIFNNSSDVFFAKEIGLSYNEIDDKLLNALELEQELNENNSPAVDLSEEAISRVCTELNNIDYKFPEKKSSIKKPTINIISILLIFILFNHFLLPGLHRISNPNTTFPRPLPFTLHSISGNSQILEGDSIVINISGIGDLPDSIDIIYNNKNGENIIKSPLKNEIYSHIFTNIESNVIWYAIKENNSFFSLWNSIKTFPDTIFVTNRPHITNIDFEIIPPKYTKKQISKQIGNTSIINAINGSKIKISAIVNKNIESAWLQKNDTNNKLQIVNNNTINGTLTVNKDLIVSIICADKDSIENLNPIKYKVNAIPDSPPALFISYPEDSFEIDETNIIPFNIRINDDYGFSEMWIDYFIQSSLDKTIESKNYIKKTIPKLDKNIKNQLVEYNWDISGIELDLDDKIYIKINVADNNTFPSPSITSSNTIIGYFPTIDDLFNNLEEEEEIINIYSEQINLSIDEVQELVEEMELKLLKSDEMSWEDKQKSNQILDSMEEIFDQIEEIKESLQEIEEQAEKNNLISSDLIEKFEKFQELLDNVMNDDLMEAMEKMKEAMENMDTEKMMEALENFDYDLEAFEEEIDRFIDMFEQAIAEQKIDELVKNMEQMVEKQQSILNELLEDPIENLLELSNKERQQEEQFKNIQNLMDDTYDAIENLSQSAAQMISDIKESEAVKSVQKNLKSSRENMQSNNIKKALNDAEISNSKLNEILDEVKKVQDKFQQDTISEMIIEFLSVVKNLLIISHKQEKINNASNGLRSNSPELRNITKMQNNTRTQIIKSIQQLIELSKKTFYITPSIGKALGKSKSNMDKAILAFEQKKTSRGIKNQKIILFSINAALELLINAMEEMNATQSASGFDSYMKQLEEMSGQQQGINQGTMQLSQMGMMAQQMMMQKLQQQQQALQKSLEEMLSDMPGGENTGGLSKANEDMKETIDDFRRKKVDQKTIERQEQILSRMLDSQKSLKQKDFSERRKSTSATQFNFTGPSGLPLDMGNKQLFLMDSMESALKEGHSRDYQKMIKTYFMHLQTDSQE